MGQATGNDRSTSHGEGSDFVQAIGEALYREKSRTGRFVDTGMRDVNRRVVASGGELQPEGKVRSAAVQ